MQEMPQILAQSEPGALANLLLFVVGPGLVLFGLILLFLFRQKLRELSLYGAWRRAAVHVRFKSVMSLVAVAIACVIFVPVLRASFSLESTANGLARAVAEIQIDSNQSAAQELRDKGTVTLNGRSFGGPWVQRQLPRYFQDGKLVDQIGLVAVLIRDDIPAWAPSFMIERRSTTWLLLGVAAAWLVLIVWLELIDAFLITLLGTISLALPTLWWGSEQWMIIILGIGLLTFAFAVLMKAMLFILGWPSQAFSVAHTVVKESMRLRISVVCICLLLLALPLVPLTVDAGAPLRYQLQTFISRSMGLTYAVAACMTVLLATASVAFEIRDRQIWQLVSKPMSRFSYLLGKWMGVCAVNLVLFIVCGISIFTYIQFMRARPATDDVDAAAVAEEVLTSRAGAFAIPQIEPLSRDQLLARVDDYIRSDSMIQQEITDHPEKENDIKKEIAVRFQTEHKRRLRTIDPGEMKTYVFEGLGPAKNLRGPLMLRHVFHIGAEDQHETFPVIFEFPLTGEHIPRDYVPVVAQVIYISPNVIDEDGRVTLNIYNAGFDGRTVTPGTLPMNFDDDELEILYRVSTFEANFVRAITENWLKLSFLAMVGVVSATFLSFSVSILCSFTVLMCATMVSFLDKALDYYDLEKMQNVPNSVIAMVGKTIVFVFGKFGQLDPNGLLVEGRHIPNAELATAAFLIGGLWSGAVLLIGYMIFRRRELAIYSGQG